MTANTAKNNTRLAVVAACIITIAASGCGSKDSFKNKKDVVAYVNKDPIYKDDLKRDLALRAKLDPAFKVTPDSEREILDSMIERKLIVQYAMEKGLARDERFVSAIRMIWEHTLIRNFIDYKKKELADYLFATNEDVAKYYDNMSCKATFKVFKSSDKSVAEEAYKKYLQDKDASGWETIGPVSYEDITSGVLIKAFDMPEGEVKVFEDLHDYYVIYLAAKEKVEIEPIDNLRPDIEKRVIALKERMLFEDWLNERKRQSTVKINKDLLK